MSLCRLLWIQQPQAACCCVAWVGKGTLASLHLACVQLHAAREAQQQAYLESQLPSQPISMLATQILWWVAHTHSCVGKADAHGPSHVGCLTLSLLILTLSKSLERM